MSSDQETLIVARDLGKAYPIYSHPIDRLKHLLIPGGSDIKRFWALKGVDINLRRGETIGILGRNGAGKSTLLQLLCGTLTPTTGSIESRGRISALLELGAGFNPDFTGRENVFLYGAVLGLRTAEIEERLDAILAFAEIGEFIDLPVKTYSSGMFVRLAFSVAINVDPDVLIVDEALAVGDARFQHRCITRIRQMQQNGVAIIYVSHDTEGVKRLCQHVIALHKGEIVKAGDPSMVANWYLAFAAADFDLERFRKLDEEAGALEQPQLEASTKTQSAVGSDAHGPHGHPALPDAVTHDDAPEFKYFRYGDGTARFTSIYLTDQQQAPLHVVSVGDTVELHLRMRFAEEREHYGVGFFLRDTLGTNLIGINTFQEGFSLTAAQAGEDKHLCLRMPLDLKPGYYSISPALAYDQNQPEWMDYIDNALIFRVVDPDPKRTIFGVYLPPEREFREL